MAHNVIISLSLFLSYYLVNLVLVLVILASVGSTLLQITITKHTETQTVKCCTFPTVTNQQPLCLSESWPHRAAP